MATQGEEKRRLAAARLSSALKRARENGVELLTVAFPPLPASAFAQIARANSGLCFFFENREKRLAELALNFRASDLFVCKNARLETLRECFPKKRLALSLLENSDPPAEPKIFFAGTFEKTAKNFAAIPRWQLSCDGEKTSVRACVFPQREVAVSATTLRREFERIEKFASSAPKVAGVPARQKIVEKTDVPASRATPTRLALIRRAVSAVRAGAFRKIVLAHKRDFLLKNFPKNHPAPPQILAALRERFLGNGCTIFCAQTASQNAGGAQIILGATPETLAHVARGRLATEAVAGTAKNDGADFPSGENLARDPKERREHRLVVDFILRKLRRNGLKPNFCAEPQILKLPNVFHLRTEISSAVPAEMDAGKICAFLHPTPAMCGLPVEKVAKFIRQNEAFSRENFASPVGFLAPSGEGFFAVAIRCAKFSGKNARIYAASGIVSESVPEKECAEIDAKFSAILSAFECVAAGTPRDEG